MNLENRAGKNALRAQVDSENDPAQAGEAFSDGEFDPGSGRTLAACLRHASRAAGVLRGAQRGERRSNTWVTCPEDWDNPRKLGKYRMWMRGLRLGHLNGFPLRDGPAAYQVVGEVTAHQADDG